MLAIRFSKCLHITAFLVAVLIANLGRAQPGYEQPFRPQGNIARSPIYPLQDAQAAGRFGAAGNAVGLGRGNAPSLTTGIDSLFGADGLLPEERVSIAVYEKCNRSVVHITTRSSTMDLFSQISVREGSGSGSVLDKNGHILTNNHVIEDAREITVRISGTSYEAKRVGQDEATDIAVLKIDAPASQLLPLVWGDSSRLRVGQHIYAIGNPFGLERSMSSGMISSLNRQIPSEGRREMRSLIQIDASINQGNSGGPLLNTRGQLIGMNTAIMSSDGDSAGVGFAIPVSTLNRIVPQLISTGRVIRPSIGITRAYESEEGLLIVSVQRNGPADLAGLNGISLVTKTYRQGPYSYQNSSLDASKADLILAIDGRPIKTSNELLDYVGSKQPGDQVTLTVEREEQTRYVTITLGQL